MTEQPVQEGRFDYRNPALGASARKMTKRSADLADQSATYGGFC
jgi:hypothetical protein